MPLPFTIRLVRTADHVEEVCAGTITDADWQLFASFRDYAKDLESAEWVRAGLDHSYSARQEDDGVMTVDAPNRPSDAAVRELLHLMRPFVLQSEPTWYPRVNSRLRGYLEHPFLRHRLARSRRVFDNGEFQLYGQVSVNSLPLHDDRTFGLWLNAFEYHRDPDKRAKLEAAFHGPPDEYALAVFRSVLAGRAREVLHLADLISNLERSAGENP